MTDTRHEQPRCPICRWPYRADGCQPWNCSFRPKEHTPEYNATVLRYAAHDRLTANGNDHPTLEDVDAELAPKGLPVIELDGPVWVGEWRPSDRNGYTRDLLKPGHESPRPWVHDVRVRCETGGLWTFEAGLVGDRSVWGEDHPTPEAAQVACEAAIIAAWRNR